MMRVESIGFILPLFFIGIISAGIAALLWRRRSSPGVFPIISIMLADIIWSFGSAFQHLSTTPRQHLFWTSVAYSGSIFIPAFLFAFVLEYISLKEKLPRHYWAILFAEPLIVFFLILANGIHQLVELRYQIDLSMLIKFFSIEYGSVLYFHFLFSLIVVGIVFLILVRAFKKAPVIIRRQIAIILIGIGIPIVAGLVDILFQKKLLSFEIIPYTFIFAQASLFVAAGKYRFLGIPPIGRGNVIDHLIEGVIILDHHNRIIDFNSSARQLFNCLTESTIGNPVEALRVNLDCENLLKAVQKIIVETNFSLSEIAEKNGHLYEVRLIPIQNHTKAESKRMISILDISEQKILQDAVHTSEEKYRNLVERSGDGIMIVQESQIKYLNRQVAIMLGYTVEEIQNTYFIHYFSPECQQEIAERHQRRIIGEVVGSRYDSVMIHRNGNRISVELSDSLMQYEDRPASLIFIRNTTEQNVIKEELESSLSLMKSTLESTADGIMVVNEENVVVRSNQRFESIWQLPSGWQHIFDAEDIIDYLASQSKDPDRFVKHMREMMAQPESAGYDQVFLKDGRVIERYATPYKIEGNYVDRRFAGKVWNFRDVTARLKTEEALRRVNEQLTETVRELENRNQEVTLLGEMGDLLHSCSTLDEAYTVVSDFAKRIFPNGSGALFVLNANRNRIEAVTSFGDMSGQTMDFPPDYCWALRRGRVHTVNSTQSDLYCRHISQLSNDDRTYICVPMIAQSETIGFLHVNGESSQTRMERLAIMVAETVAMSIANIRLRETLRLQSIRDPLTGLYNRRYMESALDLEIRRAIRYHHRVGILMIDIDRFKVFNDLYGHKTGDQLLRLFGAYLEGHSRSEDIVCRYGGEEFLIILPGAGQAECLEKGELIRSGVQSLPIEHDGENLSFTVSIGLAIYPDEGITADIVVNAADQALYEAKNKGRNRVVSAGVTGAMSYEIKASRQLP